MTMTKTKTGSRPIAAALLVLDAIALAGLWAFRPERSFVWALVALALTGMAFLLHIVTRPAAGAIWSLSAEPIARAICFGGLILLVSFTAKLAGALDVVDASELSRRGTMVVLGVFLAKVGNAVPKALTPLADMRCDPARAQAFQRFAGWTWVLTGLAFALAWIALPVEAAKAATVTLIILCVLLIATRLLRLRRARPRAV